MAEAQKKPVPVRTPVLMDKSREVVPYPFGADATFLVQLPMPTNPTGGPTIRGARTTGTMRAGQWYRRARGYWIRLAAKIDSEGKQLYKFQRDPRARSVDEIHEERKEFYAQKEKAEAEIKARKEADEREEAERRARIKYEAEAKVKAEMEAEEVPEDPSEEASVIMDDADDDFDLEEESPPPHPTPKKRPAKRKAKKKSVSKS